MGEGAPAAPAPSAGSDPSGQPVLEARHLTFAYRRGRPVIRDLSFVVSPGERVALEAPSGAGKTTLCRLLAGYLEPDAGDVLVGVAPLVPAPQRFHGLRLVPLAPRCSPNVPTKPSKCAICTFGTLCGNAAVPYDR
ncbi:ATP-binding cassette domain-containing protein [uncultured Parolsenella sp.]|uniref:ATP-binding cassette domain-containing protein n=1 Tax=uncultured Parolsenella sp. TaxID=2083008 RepID=UPI0027D96653|nr:ATP-binding cassette domain-containing protein [uncultured Parolsenella sp.]